MSLDLLPPNALPSERALAASLARLSDVPVPLADLWNPAACPSGLLPWLAWALSIDDWQSGWSDTVKRAAIAEALKLHRTKGTPAAVERALIVTGAPNAVVEEWFEYSGDPCHFRVVIDIAGEAVSGDLEARLLATVAAYQNVRSHLDGLTYNLRAQGEVPAVVAGLHSSEKVTIYPR